MNEVNSLGGVVHLLRFWLFWSDPHRYMSVVLSRSSPCRGLGLLFRRRDPKTNPQQHVATEFALQSNTRRFFRNARIPESHPTQNN